MNSSAQGTFALFVFLLLVFFFVATAALVVPADLPSVRTQEINRVGVPGVTATNNAAEVLLATPTAIIVNADTVIVLNDTTADGRQLLRYTVQRGEWLRAIAERYGTTVEAVLALNPEITDPDLLRPGQEILLPVPTN